MPQTPATRPGPDKPLLQREPPAAWVLGATLAVCLILAIGAVNLAGEVYEAVTDAEGVSLLDQPALDWAIANRTPALTAFVAWYSNTGGPLWQPIVTGLVVIFLAWRWRDPTPVVLTLIAVGGSLLMTVFGKQVIGRARPPIELAVPPHETTFSFPSGHSLNALVIAGILLYLLLRHFHDRGWFAKVAWTLFLVTYAVTMGLSRVFLGHHWLTDVLVAWAIGLAWLAIVIACHRVWRTVRRRVEPGPIEEERDTGSLTTGPEPTP